MVPGSNSGRWEVGGGLQALLEALMAAYSGQRLWSGRLRDRTRQEALADRTGASWRGRSVGEDVGSAADGRRQAGSGMARNRARARLNWVSQGQRWGRCKVRRRAERVSRPAREKKRRRRVLVVTIRLPRPMRAVQRARLCAITWMASQAAPTAKRPDGEMVEPDAVLEVAYRVLYLGVAAMVGLQF